LRWFTYSNNMIYKESRQRSPWSNIMQTNNISKIMPFPDKITLTYQKSKKLTKTTCCKNTWWNLMTYMRWRVCLLFRLRSEFSWNHKECSISILIIILDGLVNQILFKTTDCNNTVSFSAKLRTSMLRRTISIRVY